MQTVADIAARNGLPITDDSIGTRPHRCPKCSQARSVAGQRLRPLAITITPSDVRWCCHHCGWSGVRSLDWQSARPTSVARPLRSLVPPTPIAIRGDDWHVIWPVPADVRPWAPRDAVRVWDYRDERGRLLYRVCRFQMPNGGKTDRPLSYGEDATGKRGWKLRAPPSPRPLYGLDRLANRPEAPVVICEGEKSADAARELFTDFVAVTSPNGSKSASRADWRPLIGRSIAIWPDADVEGRDYARDVKSALAHLGVSVRIVAVPDTFPRGWDLADEPPPGIDLAALRTMLDTAR